MICSKNRNYRRIGEKMLNISAYLLTLFIEISGMYRFYFSRGDYFSTDCLVTMAILFGADILIFESLYKASNMDCGRAAKYEPDNINDSHKDVCHKCDALRIDPFVHHCSQCDHCIELMDHHCGFIGQCVGKGNIKYFIQFTTNISLLLIYACVKILTLFYTLNVERNEGVQCLSDLFLPTPFHLPWVIYYSEEQGGYPMLRSVDNYLFIVCGAFGVFTLGMAFSVINNVRRKTSEVDKLKPGKFLRVFVEPRSAKEVLDIIYGPNAGWMDYLLPTPTKV